MGQKRLWALLPHFFYPLRQSRQGFASPSQALPRQFSQGESGHARKLYGLAGNCTAPLKPSPTGGRWRVAPDEGQHQLPRRGSQGLKSIAKVRHHEETFGSALGAPFEERLSPAPGEDVAERIQNHPT